MLAKRLVSILPTLSLEEQIEITKIHSISGELKNDGLITTRPFRMPHHTVPISSVIGGGRIPKPGEISLAHLGVLFFDEITEFNRNILESLREPLEEKWVQINRLNGRCIFPCNFMFIASMNPCPCGYYGDDIKECKCSLLERNRYLNKISGPLLDRIDIQIEVKRPKYEKVIESDFKNESSKNIRERVNLAREIQKERYSKNGIYTNAELTPKLLKEYCKLDYKGEKILEDAFKKMNLSVRAHERILKVSRTIADLDGREDMAKSDVFEAGIYRKKDW